jgi:hypothetical protein
MTVPSLDECELTFNYTAAAEPVKGQKTAYLAEKNVGAPPTQLLYLPTLLQNRIILTAYNKGELNGTAVRG